MEIKGKIIAVLKENSGKSANGTWKNQQFVLETEDEHPKKFLFEVWGDRINEFAIKDGESLTVCYLSISVLGARLFLQSCLSFYSDDS